MSTMSANGRRHTGLSGITAELAQDTRRNLSHEGVQRVQLYWNEARGFHTRVGVVQGPQSYGVTVGYFNRRIRLDELREALEEAAKEVCG